jgi:hypothetical protein
MYTSILCFALSAGLAPNGEAIPVNPSWRNDYPLALKEGRRARRPLAIFVGSGPDGWDSLSKDGSLDKEARQLLEHNYVCVYLDSDTVEGRRLADQLELTRGRGVILSDVTGEKQAFWHAGPLSNENLNHYLRKYSDPERLVQSTETVPEARPQAPPVYQQPPMFYRPAMMSFGGGCSS